MNDKENDKKPFWGPSTGLFPGFFVMLVVMMVILISFMSLVTIGIEESRDRAECECREACEDLGYDFQKIWSQGYLDEIRCYCWDGNQSVRLY